MKTNLTQSKTPILKHKKGCALEKLKIIQLVNWVKHEGFVVQKQYQNNDQFRESILKKRKLEYLGQRESKLMKLKTKCKETALKLN